jgi:hypothetical protein
VKKDLEALLASPKPRHRKRERAGGRYATSPPCDACGKPGGTDPLSDDEVMEATGSSLGLVLCDRKTCEKKRDALGVAERAALYAATRARG